MHKRAKKRRFIGRVQGKTQLFCCATIIFSHEAFFISRAAGQFSAAALITRVFSSKSVSLPLKKEVKKKITFYVKASSGFKRDFPFLQELNRLRKAALAFGFLDLLKGVADMLERECTLLPDTAHPDAAFQLTHAAQQLKVASTGASEYAAYDHNIAPLQTDFSSSTTERL